MDLGIKGKRALVCAASQGIGRAIAQVLYDEGADLFLLSRDKDKIQAVADEIAKDKKGNIFVEACDLASAESRDKLIDSVKRVFSGVDILVHNTGGPKPTKVEETTLLDWERGYTSLFPGIVHLNGAFLPGMKERLWGRIIAVTSLSIMEPIPNLAVSNAMRAAVTGMLKTLADEVAQYNVCVNCVAPGLILTDRTEERIQGKMAQAGGSRDEHLDEFVASVPARRLGTPEEFAAVVAFLASEKASYITGSTICVDGGKRRSQH